MDRIIRIVPGYDRRDPDPNKSYGITDIKIVFTLKGEEGATTFSIRTGRYPRNVMEEKVKKLLGEGFRFLDDEIQRIVDYSGDFPVKGEELDEIFQWKEFLYNQGLGGEYDLMPSGDDIAYHSKKPKYDWQKPISSECEFTGGICYWDCSCTLAETIWDMVVHTNNVDIIWLKLEEFYESHLL